MRLLITGLSGSLGPKLAVCARSAGWEVVDWNHHQIAPDDQALSAWLPAQRVDAIAHLALGAETWAAQLAGYAAAHRLPFLFTSTAMVFHHDPDGPHRPDDPLTARDDYGRYKIRCEEAVRAANPAACIVRLGWQIDPDARGNNMLAALDRQQAQDRCIGASTRWRPACSFMADTTAAMMTLLGSRVAATVHLDSNAAEGHSFADIVRALRSAYGREHWVLRENADYVHDQRLLDGVARVPALSTRLPALRPGATGTTA